MKVKIDFSIFLSSGHAFGKVDGEMHFPFVPIVGDTVSLMFADPLVLPAGHALGGHLKVSERIALPGENGGVLLSLEDMVVGTQAQAVAICEYLGDGFGLHVDVYDSDL